MQPDESEISGPFLSLGKCLFNQLYLLPAEKKITSMLCKPTSKHQLNLIQCTIWTLLTADYFTIIPGYA